MKWIRWPAAAGLAAFCACGTSASGEHSAAFPDDAERRRRASPVAEVWVSPADAELSSINQVAVDSRGNAYVPDFYRSRVVVFGPDGRLVRSVGRRGRGPGEFQSIRSVQVLRGDSLLVYDGSLGRVNVFAPDADREAYVVTVQGAAPWAMERTHANDAYVARYESGMRFGGGMETAPRQDLIRVLNLDGSRRTDVLSFPARSFIVARQSMTPNPWGHNGFVRLDSRDRLHYVWSDTLGVATYDLQGLRTGEFHVRYVPPQVGSADLDRELNRLSPQGRALFTTALRDSLPERWPAVRGLLIDDRDRLWLELAGPATREVEWAAFSPAGAYLGSALFPAGTIVHHVRGTTAVAEKKDEQGAPRLVLYQMIRSLR